MCISGKRACPPEDCGGVWGYYEMLEALGDPDHEEHDEMKEWIGGEFDLEAFSVEAVNEELRRVGPGQRPHPPNSSSSSTVLSRAGASAPSSKRSARSRLCRWSSTICSSMVPFVTSRYTVTGRV